MLRNSFEILRDCGGARFHQASNTFALLDWLARCFARLSPVLLISVGPSTPATSRATLSGSRWPCQPAACVVFRQRSASGYPDSPTGARPVKSDTKGRDLT